MSFFGAVHPCAQAWQVLPLVPPETEYWSPYSGLDALCGNPLIIDIEDLITRGLLDPSDRPAEARAHPRAWAMPAVGQQSLSDSLQLDAQVTQQWSPPTRDCSGWVLRPRHHS